MITPKYVPIVTKLLTTLILWIIYFLMDLSNIFSKYFLVKLPILKPLVIPIDKSTILISLTALIITILTFLYSRNYENKKSAISTIYKLIDLIELSIKNVDKNKLIINKNDIKYNFDRIDLRRLFLLKLTIDNNIDILLNSIEPLFKPENNDGFETPPDLEKKLNTILKKELNYRKLEEIMSLLIKHNILNFQTSYNEELVKPYLTPKEFKYLNSKSNFFEILKSEYDYLSVFRNNWMNVEQIEYICNKVSDPDLSLNSLYRLIHRAIKITNNSTLSYEEKINMIGIIRAIIPDYILIGIFYNCTFTKRGNGLALQLVGTCFFGTKDDFENTSFSQHFNSSDLNFLSTDILIMQNLYADTTINPGKISKEDFHITLNKHLKS